MTRRQRREEVKERQLIVNTRLQALDERLVVIEHRSRCIELWEDVPAGAKQRMKHEILVQAERLEGIKPEQILWVFEVRKPSLLPLAQIVQHSGAVSGLETRDGTRTMM